MMLQFGDLGQGCGAVPEDVPEDVPALSPELAPIFADLVRHK
jgi:hypothetical protein